LFYEKYSSILEIEVIDLESLLLAWLSYDGLLLFFIGVFAAIIGVLFGAAGFVLMPAMLLAGVPIHATIAANKFATGISSFSTIIFFVVKKKVSLKLMLPLMGIACVGGISGAFLTTRLSEQTMNIVACIVLIAMFFLVLKGNKHFVIEDSTITPAKPTYISPFFIGMYDGGFGPGSALLNITYFLKKKSSYPKAVELTRFMMFASCMGAFTFYFFYGIVHWDIAIPVTVGSIIGSHMGLKVVPYIKGKWIQALLPIIFFVLIVQVVTDLIF
jgi:uncharacterized protein